MKNKAVQIIKASGKKVVFDSKKLEHSLNRSGASETIIQQILSEVSDLLYEGISTKDIYKKAFGLLRKSSRSTAARYKLKKAIQELGPTGYPFENFVGEILSHQGFTTQVGVVVQGHCVKHEVDVVAEKKEKHFMVECKFHSSPGRYCDVKVPLYIQSRFKDVEKQWKKQPGHDTKFHQGWIVTNTRFTTDAIQYGNCVGLQLISWDFPKEGSLKERVDISGLHPLTCLTTLTKKEKQVLLSKDKVLCMDLCKEPTLLDEVGIKKNRINSILKEAGELCNKT